MKHVFAKLDQTPLFNTPNDSNSPKLHLTKGAWIGIVATSSDWLQVITTEGNGFMKIQHTYKEDNFKLRVLPSVSGQLSYAV